MSKNTPAPAAPDPDVRVAATGAPEWYHEGRLVQKDEIVAVTPDVAARVVAAKAAQKV
jgi:hypothetical protein